ncbi:hypothetical protein OSB04_004125 [Centaurea solstitialis]|uniref:Uncharacterized protein n=1 Tax=Centaurea solstitialis TaxID=347529 RepID=A0AA38WVH5_9ASTR|nr:hypothetical protein OSB04_004125 [Centaurea solstitialis]
MSAARGWFLDSLAENHVTNSRSDFVNYQNIEGKVKLLNRRRMKVVGIGTVKLRCSNGKTLTLEKVLHVPKMSKKIVSAGELTENGCVIVLHSQAVIHGQGSIFYGEKIDRLYRLDLDHVIDISDDESSGGKIHTTLKLPRLKILRLKNRNTKGKSRLLTSVSFMLGIANLQMHQMDVKIDLLNEDLEEIYMEQPKGFVAQGKENKVCKLVNTLYSLKQAPKQ